MSNNTDTKNKKHLIDSTKSSKLSANIPSGELQSKWTEYRSKIPLVSPANKKLHIIINKAIYKQQKQGKNKSFINLLLIQKL